MKYDIKRVCGCYDRIKVYTLDPQDDKKSKEHTARVLLREAFKRCSRCK